MQKTSSFADAQDKRSDSRGTDEAHRVARLRLSEIAQKIARSDLKYLQQSGAAKSEDQGAKEGRERGCPEITP